MIATPPMFPASRFAGWLAERGFFDPRGTSTIMFGDTPELAADLGARVVSGEKAATASLLWRWEADEGAVPRVGTRYVVHDWQGAPLAMIETTSVAIRPFNQVDFGFAQAEGEGFDSLEAWRTAHWAYFSRECERLTRAASDAMPVVCQRFRLVATT